MKAKQIMCGLLFLCLASWSCPAQVPQVINYQGRLVDGTGLVNGVVSLALRLYTNAATTGGEALLLDDSNDVTVADGLYATLLGDNVVMGTLASAITQTNLFIETVVNGVVLQPRERIAAVAYALRADNAWQLTGNAGTQAGINFIGTTDAQPLEIKVNGQRIWRFEKDPFGARIIGGLSNNIGTNSGVSVISGGHFNNIASNCEDSVVGGGVFNVVNGSQSVIVGGSQNFITSEASCSVIGGGAANKVWTKPLPATIAGTTIAGGNGNENGGTHGTIGGGVLNFIGQTNASSVIAGGEANRIAEKAFYGTIAGGYHNTLDTIGRYSTIGGGISNHIEFPTFGGTIAGGGGDQFSIRGNTLGADVGVISGGMGNRMQYGANAASIIGGLANTVASNAMYAVVAGGVSNLAAGAQSLAAGSRAQALHAGSFVWSDSSSNSFSSSTNDEFSARAVGGVRFVSGVDGTGAITSGVQLAAGSGSWTFLSDAQAKQDFRDVDVMSVLERLAQLQVREWSYRTQSASIRHIGPTAQDFNTAFGYGDIPRGITEVDANGVAFAAIQGLNQKIDIQADEIRELRQKLQLMEARLNGIP